MQKEVSKLLLNYLASHTELTLAGIGRFKRVYRPAYFAGNQLRAPGSTLFFDADRSITEQSTAFSKLLAGYKLDEAETDRSLRLVFDEVGLELAQQHRFTYAGLGTFERLGGRIIFKPDGNQFLDAFGYGLESVLVQPKVAEFKPVVDEKTTVLKKEKGRSANFWLKIAAAILFLMVANFAVLYVLERQGSGDVLTQQADLSSFDSVQLPTTPTEQLATTDTVTSMAESFSAPADTVDSPMVESDNLIAAAVVNAQYAVIVGAFRDETNAEKYLQELKNSGYHEASLAGITTSGLHRVSIAKFSSQEMGEAFLEEIKRKVQADAWLMSGGF